MSVASHEKHDPCARMYPEALLAREKELGLKTSEDQQKLVRELVNTRGDDEDFETFLSSPFVGSIRKELKGVE